VNEVFYSTKVCGSVIVTSTAVDLSETSKNALAASLDIALSSPSAASDFFNISVASVSYDVVTVIASPPSSPTNPGAVAGGVIGGLVGLCLVIGLVVFMMKKSKSVAPS